MQNLSYYKAVAELYDDLIPRDVSGICDSVTRIITKYTTCRTILDLGCGTGRFAIGLGERGFHVIGMDLTSEMLERARRNARESRLEIKFIRDDMRNFRLSKKMGIIWARGSIGDLLKIDDVKKALRNIRENLQDEGIFIFDVRDRSRYLQKFRDGLRKESRMSKRGNRVTTFDFSGRLDKRAGIERMAGEITVHAGRSIRTFKVHHALRYYTRHGLTRLLKKAGFKMLEIRSGYELDRKKKPQLVIVTQRGSRRFPK